MASAEGSYLGLALQKDKDTPNTTDGDFRYLLYRQGQASPQNIQLPLDPEVGGGAMLRSVAKVGVSAGGSLDIIPRPETLGFFFYGATGSVSTSPGGSLDADYVHATTAFALTPVDITAGITNPASARPICISCDDVADVGVVNVWGTDINDTEIVEQITIAGIGAFWGIRAFKTVTKVRLPGVAGPAGNALIGCMTGAGDGSYVHTFKLGANQFDAPYFTVRNAPANLWWEQYEQCRLGLLALNFRGANFVEGMTTLMGRKPKKIADETVNASQIDSGPQFLTPLATLQLPTGTSARVLAGSFVANSSMPMDEQYIVGDYYPEGLDIVSRSFSLQLTMKVIDETLYSKMMYDPSLGNDWLASILREANFTLNFASDVNAGGSNPYSFSIAATGQSGANANVLWSCQPISMRAQRQLLMTATGTFVASPNPGSYPDPITITLRNQRANYSLPA